MPGNEMVTVWEKDPSSGRTRQAPKPNVRTPPLAFFFLPPEPRASTDIDSADFRYWVAAEALRRGADFWTPCLVEPRQWGFNSNTLLVHPDMPQEKLNSEYDGSALNFYHGTSPAYGDLVIYAGAMPDILCHELGHAILHALNVELWPPGSTEIEAFKESFGDISAILCALQVSEYRDSLLAETQRLGAFWKSSSLSRIAEQFGKAVRAERPEDADVDCLRDAWNHHNYSAPATIKDKQGPDVITVKPHSFSRIFTGAFYEAFAAMLAAKAANSARPTSGELQTASIHMRDILAKSVIGAQRRDDFFRHMAARMVDASAADATYAAIITDVFTRRSILPGAIV